MTSRDWDEDAKTLTLRLDYRFLHHAILRDLLSRVGSEARGEGKYWKYGLWLFDRGSHCQLLVREERPEGAASSGAGAVVVQAQGRDPAGLLRKIYKLLQQRSFAEKPEISLTRDGETVALTSLEVEAYGRVQSAGGRWVEARKFKFLEERDSPEDPEPKEEMMAAHRETTGIDAGPMESSDPRQEVFISYAWGDDSPAGKIRAAAVDRLQDALKADGFRVIRDRDELVPGDLIRDFMDRLAKGAHVVCVVSDKYLRSPSCMYELHQIYQRCGSNRKELAERIVPVILPEVEIGNLRKRAPYLMFWAREHQELEAIFKDPDLRPSAESLREVHLIRDFANHVDQILVFVNDILMPRNLGENLMNGFEAVRELLRKRMP